MGRRHGDRRAAALLHGARSEVRIIDLLFCFCEFSEYILLEIVRYSRYSFYERHNPIRICEITRVVYFCRNVDCAGIHLGRREVRKATYRSDLSIIDCSL